MTWHVRAGVMAYAVFFLFFGLPFNGYWGLIVGPLLLTWLSAPDPSVSHRAPRIEQIAMALSVVLVSAIILAFGKRLL